MSAGLAVVWHSAAGLFSQQILLNLIKRFSNEHTEIVMNETNMPRFDSIFTKRISSK